MLHSQEGILQRLQSSVEQEESRWGMKLEQSQGQLGEVCVFSFSLNNDFPTEYQTIDVFKSLHFVHFNCAFLCLFL